MKLIAPDPEVRISLPYEYTAKALLTETEKRFYNCLAQITNARCRIQVKPRLADVFQHERTNGAFQMISQKHVDFLICRNEDWMPMLGIELDDDSHQRADRKGRDMFVNNLFASTGVPLLRLPVRELDDLEKLVSELTRAWHRRWRTLELEMTPS
jgi:hypothetical protein